MKNLINIETEFTEYERIQPDRKALKKLIGRKVIYVDRVDPHRGYYRVEMGVICEVRYSRMYLNDYGKEADIRDIRDIAIKKEPPII